MSQSLLNQGNIQIPERQERLSQCETAVSIPFKSGKYSNFNKERINLKVCLSSQSLLNQGNIQMDYHANLEIDCFGNVSIPFKSGKYSNTTFYNLLNLLIYFDDFP